ncbi:MAG: histidine kinase, partial [Bacteroidota bacterium]
TIAELSIQKLKAENQTLAQQLQPHFLFNALSVLKSLIQEDADLAEDYTVKLSDFLRYGVESHQTDLVSLKEEMEFVNNYLSLQKIRFEEAIAFEVQISDNQLSGQVPIFAVQTLVENACKHNYFTEKRPLHISIETREDALIVRNNLVSLKVTERAGTGLANLSKRYEFLAGREIQIQQTETDFSVTIPVIQS